MNCEDLEKNCLVGEIFSKTPAYLDILSYEEVRLGRGDLLRRSYLIILTITFYLSSLLSISTLLYVILRYLALPYPILPHFALYYLTSSYIILSYLTLPYLILRFS